VWGALAGAAATFPSGLVLEAVCRAGVSFLLLPAAFLSRHSSYPGFLVLPSSVPLLLGGVFYFYLVVVCDVAVAASVAEHLPARGRIGGPGAVAHARGGSCAAPRRALLLAAAALALRTAPSGRRALSPLGGSCRTARMWKATTWHSCWTVCTAP
jgi:hypothetical protein